jgi:YVTN family beta-propeller protein
MEMLPYAREGVWQPTVLRCKQLNDLSGRYVYVGDTGNVVDTSTLKVVKTLPVLQNTHIVVEIDWTNGTLSATSTRFGLGRVTG